MPLPRPLAALAALLLLTACPGTEADEDLDRDGIQDPGEPGIEGVPVTCDKTDGTSCGLNRRPPRSEGAPRPVAQSTAAILESGPHPKW